MSDQETQKGQADLYKRAVIEAFLKLDPTDRWSKNIVMFVVEIGSRYHYPPLATGPDGSW